MKLPTITTFIIALSFLTVAITEAKVYQWKDESGVTHYSSTPPRPKEKISDLRDDLRITDNKAIAHKTTQETKSLNEKEKKKNARSKKTKKRNYCDGQRRNLELLKRNINVKWIQNGKSTKLSSEQRNDKLRSLEDSISNDCSFGEEGERREQKRNNRPENSDKNQD
ncbi:MAG: DUF4124 domain-containing protein [Cocleimonas sp.]|nr:DUF4124 domain-containing protein [Cocleimonas sp.]